jgi:Tfp pilus assembly protein FimT
MKGFSLFEILITTTIFTMLIGIGLLMSMETLRSTVHRSEEVVIVSFLQKARSRAMNNVEQSSWGVCYLPPNYALIRGSLCTSLAVTDTIEANATVATESHFISTFPQIIFAQLSGRTASTTFTIVQDTRTAIISINNEGTILW